MGEERRVGGGVNLKSTCVRQLRYCLCINDNHCLLSVGCHSEALRAHLEVSSLIL